MTTTETTGANPGLCGSCVHTRRVETGRSTFYLCERALTDPSYRKYPPLPVLACRGYDRSAAALHPARETP